MTPYYHFDPSEGVNIDAVEISYWHCPACGASGLCEWTTCISHPGVDMVFGLGVDCIAVTVEPMRQKELL